MAQAPLSLHLRTESSVGFWSHVPAAATFQLVKNKLNMTQSRFPAPQTSGLLPSAFPTAYVLPHVSPTADTQSKVPGKYWLFASITFGLSSIWELKLQPAVFKADQHSLSPVDSTISPFMVWSH